MNELIAGAVYFFGVFAKAMQQRNIAFMNYWAAFLTSYVLAAADILVWGMVAVAAVEQPSFSGLWLMVVAIGTGGAFGAPCAMYIHHRFFTKKRFK